MNLHLKLKEAILETLSSQRQRMLFIIGKIGKDTSIELMKIIISIEDDPQIDDLFFAFHHSYDNPKNYFSEIIEVLRKDYHLHKEEIDPEGSLEHVFLQRSRNVEGDIVSSFSLFFSNLGSSCETLCRNLVFLFDPEVISNPGSFNENMAQITEKAPRKLKFIIFEDEENAKNALVLTQRDYVKQFMIPSSADQITDYMERELASNKGLSGVQRIEGLHMLGNIYGGQGKVNEAVARYKAALALLPENRGVDPQGAILNDMALMYYMNKDRELAIKYFTSALDVNARSRNLTAALSCITMISGIYVELNKRSEAITMYNKGISLCNEINDSSTKANLLSSLGDLRIEMGQTNDAMKSYEEALSLAKKLGNYFGEARETDKMAKLYQRIGKAAEAKMYEQRSKKIQKEKGFSLSTKKT